MKIQRTIYGSSGCRECNGNENDGSDLGQHIDENHYRSLFMSEDPIPTLRELHGARTASAAYEAIVEVAREQLAADRCEFLVEEDDRLVVQSACPSDPSAAPRSYPLWTGIPGGAYTNGRTCIVDDARDTRSSARSATTSADGTPEYRSLCCVPVEGYGLLLAKAVAPGSFGDCDEAIGVRLAEVARLTLTQLESSSVPIKPDGGVPPGDGSTDQLEEIADILSHDVVNPLNIVQGSLELAMETGEDEHIERAMAALERVNDLIDQVVFLARTGRLVEQTEPVEMAEVVEETWKNVGTDDATLVIEDAATIVTSRRAIRQVFENLLANAIEHAGPSVTIRVGVYDDGFYVEDDGPGIHEEDRQSVFERGYSTGERNSGLGLNIVQRIAEAHGWDINVSDSSDGGARFEFSGIDFH